MLLVGVGPHGATEVGGGGDPNFANVVLLVGFDGEAAGTSATDESPSAHSPLTFEGNAALTDSVSIFGRTTSLFCDGSGDGVRVPNSSDFHFGAGQFTLEVVIRVHETLASNELNYVLALYDTTANQRSWAMIVGEDGSGNKAVRFIHASVGTGGTVILVDVTSVLGAGGFTAADPGTMFNFAVDRDGSNQLRIYINGVMVHKSEVTTDFHASTADLMIGNTLVNNVVSSGGHDGYLDEVRITKGVARYASDSGYTPSAEPFPRS